jgi:hypothetical protein
VRLAWVIRGNIQIMEKEGFFAPFSTIFLYAFFRQNQPIDKNCSLYAKIGQNQPENRSKFALFFMERPCY